MVLFTLTTIRMSFAGAAAFLALIPTGSTAMHDTFTFGETDSVNHVYGPEAWDQVQCENVETCPGWPTNWENLNKFIPYDTSPNMCRDCSEQTGGECAFHQQSPIDLDRNITARRECKDRHRMNYEPGNCRFGRMNFEILPHVLRAYQPDYCQVIPTIDYSMGFPDDWILEFTDIAVPSHHTIEGHRFSAEVIMSHVYSARKINKLIGNVAVLLEAGTEDNHYDFLELYIKRFHQEARKTKTSCMSRRLSTSSSTKGLQDVRTDEAMVADDNDESDAEPNRDLTELEDDREMAYIREMDYVNKPPFYTGYFHPYMWYADVGTEYYFRYNGSLPEPPCFEGVHWRVMQKPIVVAPSQIAALHKLIARRMDPVTCEYENAGKPRPEDPSVVDVNRPLQTMRNAHQLVYCECVDWKSPKLSDRALCKLSDAARGVADRTWPSPAPSISPSQVPTSSSPPSEQPSDESSSPRSEHP
ncbi:hypothetical protein ACA910_012039 [Epithemia clementina (nom. ined.)]